MHALLISGEKQELDGLSYEGIEKRIFNRYTELHGKSIVDRLRKLKEEVDELSEAIDNLIEEDSLENVQHVVDEICDVHTVVTHMGFIYKMNTKDMMLNAYDKSVGREMDKNYRR